MTQSIKSQIQSLIANGYAETHVGFQPKYDAQERRGCYAQIAAPYGSTIRIYAKSYEALLEAVQICKENGDF